MVGVKADTALSLQYIFQRFKYNWYCFWVVGHQDTKSMFCTPEEKSDEIPAFIIIGALAIILIVHRNQD